MTVILLFLQRLVNVFTSYFGELHEESIRDNFVTVYELFDEMMDFGYPQATEPKILKEFIMQEGYKSNSKSSEPTVPTTLTNAVSWRQEGIVHRKNEIFLDVIERLNLLVSSTGTVLHSEILGAVKMKSFLSGMPELKLGLNDRLMFEATGRRSMVSKGKAVEMDDVKFHQCVRLARFENDRTISFIPPDSEFELMSYRSNTRETSHLGRDPGRVLHGTSGIHGQDKESVQVQSIANGVEIRIPVPSDVDSPQFK